MEHSSLQGCLHPTDLTQRGGSGDTLELGWQCECQSRWFWAQFVPPTALDEVHIEWSYLLPGNALVLASLPSKTQLSHFDLLVPQFPACKARLIIFLLSDLLG